MKSRTAISNSKQQSVTGVWKLTKKVVVEKKGLGKESVPVCAHRRA